MNRVKLFLFSVLIACGLQAQTITFHLPQAVGQHYFFVLENGFKCDTIARGTLDAKGTAVVALPSKYADYCGAGKLILPNGLINMLVNREKNVVVSTPTSDFNHAVYQNSPENEALQSFLMEQSRIMQKYLPLQQAKANIFPSDINFPRLADELNILEKKYADLNRQIAATPLYAGKIIKILRYLTFTASSPALPPFQTAEELKKYIVNEMNFSDLYTSGFFSAVFQVWYEANMNNPDSVLVTDAKKMLQRVDDVEINRAMSQAFINILSRYARREYLIPQIVSGINFPLNEQPAPALVINGDSILPKNALILFYDSDCGNCQNELHNLAEKYNMLKNNNIRVISIAADVDKNLFSETAQKTVWNENYCDFKGFESENFVKYGIVGTPTFILIDSNGIVRGRYAQLKELIK